MLSLLCPRHPRLRGPSHPDGCPHDPARWPPARRVVLRFGLDARYAETPPPPTAARSAKSFRCAARHPIGQALAMEAAIAFERSMMSASVHAVGWSSTIGRVSAKTTEDPVLPVGPPAPGHDMGLPRVFAVAPLQSEPTPGVRSTRRRSTMAASSDSGIRPARYMSSSSWRGCPKESR